jgi:hypothetical protein
LVFEIAEYIGTINQAVGNDSEVRKVSLVSCSLGSEYPKRLLPKLKEKGINNTKVSARLGRMVVQPEGTKVVIGPTGASSGIYRSSILKETYAYDEKGAIVQACNSRSALSKFIALT